MRARLPRFSELSVERRARKGRNARLSQLRAAGDAARDQRDWAAAVNSYSQVIAQDPSALDVAIQLGHAHKELGDYSRAADLYYAVLKQQPSDDLYLQIGHLEKLRGNHPRAIEHYKQSLELNPQNVDARREYEALVGRRIGLGSGKINAASGHGLSGAISNREEPPQLRGKRGSVPDAATQSPDSDRLSLLGNGELRSAGDRARDAWLWPEAALAYQTYLDRVPGDYAIWVQLGHSLKEMGNLTGGEAAYRRALELQPEEADGHLQLGHVLKLLQRQSEAVEAYRRSFALKPSRSAATELQRLGTYLADETAGLVPPQRAPAVFFEISDLLADLLDSRTISGIQRVQICVIAHILNEHGGGRALDCCFTVWEDGLLWQLPDEALGIFAELYEAPEARDFAPRHSLLGQVLDKAELVRPVPGDVVLSTGTIYRQPDLAKVNARLKRAGVRLGGYIHDFNPLTHPEFCDRRLTDSFAPSICEALLHYDFALTVSEHVAQEVRRLTRQGGYPAIPVRAVPEAHSLGAAAHAAEDCWTSAIAAVQGEEFVLCVGTLSAQKNQALLVQIWQLLLRDGVEPPFLVLVGRRGHNIGDLLSLLATSNNLGGRVHICEGLSDAELATLYRNCLFTMFPSFVEGWGLPVGESLACGKLCIAANAPPLPEVGGDCALYIDPYNAREGAGVVRRLLENRAELQRLEARIRNEFRPRSWREHGEALVAAVRELCRADPAEEQRPEPVAMPLRRVVRPFRIETGWQFGTSLAPPRAVADRALRRALLETGWYPTESWGTWMEGRRGRIGFTVAAEHRGPVRVMLQFRAAPWARGNHLAIRAGCGAAAAVPVPETRDTGQTYPHFHCWLDCVPDRDGRIELLLEVSGDLQMPLWDEPRRFCIGLARLLCLDPAEFDRPLPANQVIRPSALSGPAGAAIIPKGTSSMLAALRRRSMLTAGWCEPEAWGTRMTGHTARLDLATEIAPGEAVAVALLLRVRAGWRSAITVRSQCGASEELRISAGDPRDVTLWLECRVGPGGELGLTIDTGSRPVGAAADLRDPPLGLTGLAYGPRGISADRLALAEALLFPDRAEPVEAARAALEAGLRFSVIGHINGSYSFAATNRRLALALEAARPGTVRVEPIEGQPTRDLSRVPAAERAAFAALAAREPHEDGPAVEIARHWPVWVPPHPADLKLAYVPWEESLVPRDMVRLLNEKFHGVLVETRFVAKALIDSGLRLPVRLMGCAPDLDAYLALGETRAASPARPRPSAAAPFTFLHVSSCFPRKGVDALIAAYSRAFRRGDPVRLVIKSFPNPHNDAADQITHLYRFDPDAPEIDLINRDMPMPELVALYAAADAMVLPTRGEGFGVPAAEALAAGLPLIVTGYSGQTDFAGPEVARQVAWRFAASRSHLQSYGSVWADPDIDDLASAMREVLDAAHDPAAGRALAARVARGRRTAAALGDSAAWASRVREIALDLLSLGPADMSAAPKVAWVTTWNIRCGIATHSKYLLDPYPAAARDVTVLCDERTLPADLTTPEGPAARVAGRAADPETADRRAAEPADLATPEGSAARVAGRASEPETADRPTAAPADFVAPGPTVRVAWRAGDLKTADRLAAEIAATGARAVVIQHQPGLIRPPVLTELLLDDRLIGRKIVLALHNLGELIAWEDWPRLRDALGRVSRILVHNIRDLNLLKSCGLIGNVALLPPGALRLKIARPPVRELSRAAAPVIGTYGFFLPHKGFDVLIEAFAIIHNDWPGARLRMVTAEYPAGESPAEIARCRALAHTLGIADAIDWHTSYLTDARSLALLNGCDLLVLPHRDTPEAASGAARVAMASRVSVLVTPVAIFDEMGDALIRAPGMDASELAAGIAAVLRDQALRHKTVDAADSWLEAHDWARMSERLYGMICGLIAKHDALPGATPVNADREPIGASELSSSSG